MSDTSIFCRQIRHRSKEHLLAMQLLSRAGLVGPMIGILRQELDSMVRVIYLLDQPPEQRKLLIESSVRGVKWRQPNSNRPITDRDMLNSAQRLQGWTRLVYKFGCSFIHLSNLHDYNERDPLIQVSAEEREDVIQYCRSYHGGPTSTQPTFGDLMPYVPSILEKISDNLRVYLEQLTSIDSQTIDKL